MRIGIFGGSFDPIHLGHLALARCCLDQCALDEVRFVPTATSPHKLGRRMASGNNRAAMIELAIADDHHFTLSRYEIDRGGVSYTHETLEHFKKTEPEAEFFLLLGADMLNDLPNWRKPGDICKLAIPMAVRRAGTGEPDFDLLAQVATPPQITVLRNSQVEMPEMAISGTEIRQRIEADELIDHLVPGGVSTYITKNPGIYVD